MNTIRSLLARREALLVLASLLLLVAITARFPAFSTPGNLATVFNDTSILIMMALGQSAVILTKSIDLSVAANVALTGMTVAMLNHLFPELPLGLLICASTVLVKQHSILDVFVAIPVSAVLYFIVYHRAFRKKLKHA